MPHTYSFCIFLYIKQVKRDAATQNNCPSVIAYLGTKNYSIVNTRIKVGELQFLSQNEPGNVCQEAGLHPVPLGELTTLRHRLIPSNGIYGIEPQVIRKVR